MSRLGRARPINWLLNHNLEVKQPGFYPFEVAFNDSGTGTDTLTVPQETLSISDTGTGSDSIVAGVQTSESDSGTGSDAISVTTYPAFPLQPLTLKIELLLNGTWTDITTFVYQRNPIQISYGRPNEASALNPAQCTFTLNNRDGRFSPQNTSGAYYPFIVRNTQLRVHVTTGSTDTTGDIYSGYRFWGEVSSWPPQADPSQQDIYVPITASGYWRRLQQNSGTIGSSIKRYVQSLTGSTAPVAYWPCEDGTTAVSFASGLAGGSAMTWTGTPSLASGTPFGGSDALPALNGSVWTGSTYGGVITSPVLYTTPGTYTFTAPNVSTVTVECWGAGGGGGSGYIVGYGGGGGEYAKDTVSVTPSSNWTVQVGSGGVGGTYGFAGSNGGDSYFGASFNVIAHGGKGGGYDNPNIPFNSGVASGGTGSANATHYNGGNGGAVDTGANGIAVGAPGGGGSGGTSAAGNAGGAPPVDGSNIIDGPGAGASAVTGGGPGGNGAYSAQITNPPAPSIATMPASGPGGGGGAGIDTLTPDYEPGGSGYAGQVKVSWTGGTVPNANVMRFLLDVPSGGAVTGSKIAEWITAGTIQTIDLVYSTGGDLELIGYDSLSSIVFDSGAVAASLNGNPLIISVELTPSGSDIAWALKSIAPGGSSATTLASGTTGAATLGAVNTSYVNKGGTETGATVVGHMIVQYAVSSLTDLAAAAGGHDGEKAFDRFTRLCTEEGISYETQGSSSDTPQMGPQQDLTLAAVFQQIEDVDRGLLYEPRDQFGLGYRTRVNLQNQTAQLTLDYTHKDLTPPLIPVQDDQLIRNSVTVSRINGSSSVQTLTSGTLSTQNPPNGVGTYTYSLTANVHADSQLANLATWILDVGTFTDYRFPQVNISLTRTETSALFSAVAGTYIGDFFKISNPPSWLTASVIKNLLYGLSEIINAFQWDFQFNAVPEGVYEGVGLPTW